MHCYDCSTRNDTTPAVAVCTTCGAAVCPACARIGSQTIRTYRLFVGGNIATETRVIACPPCAAALGAHHTDRYRFAGDGVLETQ